MKLKDANIICMINARGGSKGIPRKNIKPLCGKPLIAYSIELAKKVPHFSRIIVSTEDEEIADVARRFGAEIPFMRPAELAADNSIQLDTIRYNILELEKTGPRVDAVVLLQPTSPIREPDDVIGCLNLMETENADSVVTVAEVNKYHPYGLWKFDTGSSMEPFSEMALSGYNRQGLEKIYWRTGSVYAMQRDVVVEKQALYGDNIHGYVVDEARSWFNIDSQLDWQMTEAWLLYLQNKNTEE